MQENGKTMIQINHTICNKLAFYYETKPDKFEIMNPSKARLFNGRIPEMYEKVICGSCNKDIIDQENTLVWNNEKN